MKLTRVAVKNFRSYSGETAVLPVGDGLNLLIGPNNCGKSNLLRAVALALEDSGGEQFNEGTDVPQAMSWAYPTITLSFLCDKSVGVESTLLRYVATYEQSAGSKQPYAARGELHLRVVYRKSGRDEAFAPAGNWNAKGDKAKLEKALSQFKKCIRFIYIRSGDSLSNFLAGTFNQLLHTVIQEHLSEQVFAASKRRDEYLAHLRKELLEPLGNHALEQLREVMHEIRGVSIAPFVPDLAETLSKADFVISDDAETTMLNKGTGLRGALLVALLGYLVKNSKRSLILAVEEPESFLHPGAQQELRSDLLQLAQRSDVTLLVTTHSPFMVDRSTATLITPFSKSSSGVTAIGGQIKGTEPTAVAVSSLFGEMITPTVLEFVQPLKTGIKAVLFVEGYSDVVYIQAALKVSGREDLLDGIEVRHDEGAHKAALQALLLRQMIGPTFPIAVLFDWDEPGKAARDLLKNRFNWPAKTLFTFRQWRHLDPSETPVEAEDMFDGEFLPGFLKKHGDVFLAEKVAFKDGTFHHGLTQPGKDAFIEHVRQKLESKHAGRWITLISAIRAALGV